MKHLAIKKVLIVLIAALLTLSAGISLTALLNKKREETTPYAAPSGIPSDAISISAALKNNTTLMDYLLGNRNFNDSPINIQSSDLRELIAKPLYIQNKKELQLFNAIWDGYSYHMRVQIGGNTVDGSQDVTTNNFKDHTVYLADDIDFGGDTWTPLGYRTSGNLNWGNWINGGDFRRFAGTFDGCGHTIYNFKVSDDGGTGTYVSLGFFGLVENATIKNLRLANETIELTRTDYDGYWSGDMNTTIGGLIGRIEDVNDGFTSMSNCVLNNVNINLLNRTSLPETETFGIGAFVGGWFVKSTPSSDRFVRCSGNVTIKMGGSLLKGGENNSWPNWFFNLGKLERFDGGGSEGDNALPHNCTNEMIVYINGHWFIDNLLNDMQIDSLTWYHGKYEDLKGRDAAYGGYGYNITNELSSKISTSEVNSKWYCPRTSGYDSVEEFNSGVPLPMIFLYDSSGNCRAKKVNVEFSPPAAAGSYIIKTLNYNGEDEDQKENYEIYIPYDPADSSHNFLDDMMLSGSIVKYVYMHNLYISVARGYKITGIRHSGNAKDGYTIIIECELSAVSFNLKFGGYVVDVGTSSQTVYKSSSLDKRLLQDQTAYKRSTDPTSAFFEHNYDYCTEVSYTASDKLSLNIKRIDGTSKVGVSGIALNNFGFSIRFSTSQTPTSSSFPNSINLLSNSTSTVYVFIVLKDVDVYTDIGSSTGSTVRKGSTNLIGTMKYGTQIYGAGSTNHTKVDFVFDSVLSGSTLKPSTSSRTLQIVFPTWVDSNMKSWYPSLFGSNGKFKNYSISVAQSAPSVTTSGTAYYYPGVGYALASIVTTGSNYAYFKWGTHSSSGSGSLSYLPTSSSNISILEDKMLEILFSPIKYRLNLYGYATERTEPKMEALFNSTGLAPNPNALSKYLDDNKKDANVYYTIESGYLFNKTYEFNYYASSTLVIDRIQASTTSYGILMPSLQGHSSGDKLASRPWSKYGFTLTYGGNFVGTMATVSIESDDASINVTINLRSAYRTFEFNGTQYTYYPITQILLSHGDLPDIYSSEYTWNDGEGPVPWILPFFEQTDIKVKDLSYKFEVDNLGTKSSAERYNNNPDFTRNQQKNGYEYKIGSSNLGARYDEYYEFNHEYNKVDSSLLKDPAFASALEGYKFVAYYGVTIQGSPLTIAYVTNSYLTRKSGCYISYYDISNGGGYKDVGFYLINPAYARTAFSGGKEFLYSANASDFQEMLKYYDLYFLSDIPGYEEFKLTGSRTINFTGTWFRIKAEIKPVALNVENSSKAGSLDGTDYVNITLDLDKQREDSYSGITYNIVPNSVISLQDAGSESKIEITKPDYFKHIFGYAGEYYDAFKSDLSPSEFVKLTDIDIVLSKDYTTAKGIDVRDAQVVYVIPMGGYSFSSNKVAYIFGGSSIGVSDISDMSSLPVDWDSRDSTLYLDFDVDLDEYDIPLYYPDLSTRPGYYTNTTAHITVESEIDLEVKFREVINSLPESYREGVFNSWVLAADAEVLIRQGFTHIGNGESSPVPLADANVADYFAGSEVTLYKEYYEVDCSPFDRFIYIFSIGSKAIGIYSVDNVEYYTVLGVKAGSYGGLEVLEDLTIERDNPYIRLGYDVVEMEVLPHVYSYGRVQDLEIGDESDSELFKYQYYDNTTGAWKEYKPGEPFYASDKILKGQNLSFRIDGAELRLEPALNEGFAYRVAVPYTEDSGTISYMYMDDAKLSEYYTYEWVLTSTEGDGQELIRSGGDFDYNIFDSDCELKLKLTPKTNTHSIYAATEGVNGFENLDKGGYYTDDARKDYATGGRGFIVSTLSGSNISLEVQGSPASNSVLEITSDVYYTITLSAPAHLEKLVEALGREGSIMQYHVYILPRLSIAVSGGADYYNDYYFYNEHGYGLKLDGTSPVKSGDVEGSTLTTFDCGTSKKNVLSGYSLAICYELIEYEIPLYYPDITSGEEVERYSIEHVDYNVEKGKNFADSFEAVKQRLSEALGQSNAFNKFDGWIMAADAQVLKAQGFTHIEIDNSAVSLDTADVEAAFSKSKVTLYKAFGPTTHDRFTYIFSIGSKIAQPLYVVGDCAYYTVSGLLAGSYGNLEDLDLKLEQDNPYIKLGYKVVSFDLLSHMFSYTGGSVEERVEVKTDRQYKADAFLIYTGEPYYSNDRVLPGQKLEYRDGTLSLSSALKPGFEYTVYVPITLEDGAVSYISPTSSTFSLHYVAKWVLYNEDDGREIELSRGDVLNFEYEEFSNNCTLRLILQPRTYVQTVNSANAEAVYTGLGGYYSEEKYAEYREGASMLRLSLFAGSKATITSAVEANGTQYYKLEFLAPSHLAELVSSIADYKEFVVYIEPKISTQTPDVSYKTYYFYTAHGYALNTEDGSPVKYSTGNSGTKFTMEIGSVCKNMTEQYTFAICYDLEQNKLPVYYIAKEEVNDASAEYAWYENSYNYDTRALGLTGSLMLDEAGIVDGWILTSNVKSLMNQEFTHVKTTEGVKRLAELSDEEIEEIFDTSNTITLYRDITNATAGKEMLDYYEWTFSYSERIHALDGVMYYLVTQLNQHSFGKFNFKQMRNNAEVGPYIRAYVAKTYELEVDNLIKDKENGGASTSIHSNDMPGIEKYFGVGGEGIDGEVSLIGSVNNAYGEGYGVKFIVANSSRYNYTFFTSHQTEGVDTAFYYAEDFMADAEHATSTNGTNYWFVYNYGYEIAGWKIIVKASVQSPNSRTLDYYLSGGEWVYADHISGGVVVPVNALNNGSLTDVASFLYELQRNSANTQDVPAVILIPAWEEATIRPYYTANDVARNLYSGTTFKYGEEYDFSNYNSASTPDGKSLIYFTVEAGEQEGGYGVIINPKDGNITMQDETVLWNYRELKHGYYEHVGNIYSISLKPVFVDNIYRIDLAHEELKSFTDNKGADEIERYIFTEGDYSLAAASYASRMYDYEDKELYSEPSFYTTYAEYKAGASWLWVEKYAEVIAEFRTNYEEVLFNEGKLLDIFRKIYYAGDLAYDAEQNSLTGTIEELYIYLANSQQVGELPAVEDEYYQLILWKNVGSDAYGREINYGYKTDIYDPSLHDEAREDAQIFDYTIWQHSQTYTPSKGYDLELHPHYFRKYYYLKPETVLVDAGKTYDPSEVGYLIIRADDILVGEKSINYLAIYLDGHMTYYAFDASEEWKSLIAHTDISAESGRTALIAGLERREQIKIYFGCDVYFMAYDQSKDAEAMASGKYDEMIGYAWTGITWWDENALALYKAEVDEELSNYTNYIEDDAITNRYNLTVGKEYEVKVSYKKLVYTYDIYLVDPEGGKEDTKSGTFTVVYSDKTTNSGATYVTDKQIRVGEVVTITYSAALGYEFGNEAFMLVLPNGQEVLLEGYEELLNEDGSFTQVYIMSLTGTWLREHFYCAETYLGEEVTEYRDFALDKTDLGEVDIHTGYITFEHYIKIYDSSISTDEAFIDSVKAGGWNLTLKVSLTDAFSAISNGWGYAAEDGREYAALKAYGYKAKSPRSGDNLLREYSFPLNSIPRETYDITRMLGDMLGTSGGKIVPADGESRRVYTVLEVRELFRIEVKIERQENDTNDSNRTVTVTNSATNSLELTAKPGSPAEVSGSIFSYNGQKNEIRSDYDRARYTGVSYQLDGVDIVDGFEASRDSTLVVKFIPRLLNVTVRYYLEGEETTREGVIDELPSIKISNQTNLKVGSKIGISYELNPDYLIAIKINGKRCNADEGGLSYTVSSADYMDEGGEIEIGIYLTKQSNEQVVINMMLLDSDQNRADDIYGDMLVKVESKVYADAEGKEIEVVVGRSVSVKLELATGYRYSGRISFRGKMRSATIVNDEILLVDSFDPAEDFGIYTIYLEKELIDLRLISNAGEGLYTMETDNVESNVRKSSSEEGRQVDITNTYVGSVVRFGVLDEKLLAKNYELDYYYYITKSGARERIVGSDIRITSKLIADAAREGRITFGVQSKEKYRVEIEMAGSTVALSRKILYDTDMEGFENGGYYGKGTKIELDFYTSRLTKYEISLSIEGRDVATMGEDGHTRYELEVERDTKIRAYIRPSRYLVEVEEYHYDTLRKTEHEEEAKVEASERFSDLEREYEYEDRPRLEIEGNVDKSEDWLITKVEIEIGGEKITIEIDEEGIRVTSSGMLSRGADSYSLTIGEEIYEFAIAGDREHIEIVHEIETNVKIKIHYTNLKEVSPS